MRDNNKSETWVILPDLHHPDYDKSAFDAVLHFMRENRERVKGVVLLGDNMDCQNISRHTKGKPRLREAGGVQRDFDAFDRDILQPIEKSVRADVKKIFHLGNHEDWLEQWLDENPEFEGAISFEKNLRLRERGWDVVPQGEVRWIGKLLTLHGDQVGSAQHVAKKLVDSYCATAVMGHVHRVSMYTKISEAKARDKWAGYTLGTLGNVAPRYAKGRPNAFMHCVGIVEMWAQQGYVNVYPAIIINGRFAYGGRVYGA